MLAETWMNRTPRPTRTQLQIAEADARLLSARRRELVDQLSACEEQLSDAYERIQKLSLRP